ncbi:MULTISPECIES: gamma-glutamyltransferase [unclassified Rhodanobacter]|uniref:gamma-glutamyltransferase n=1 Tax=unclassified Rhodanobacter TaxID=2621553 RepID=UPI001BDF8172|nr:MULTISPECIES: gamma-glutamyltransferase [unclassified Rhodanobacter]MBT2145270.1 gamma-glutamyltransferase [Rhodanobacter sp. LX-99]MBT2149315.1 gamma-glutamyltransferase [Rhodanobacter sp. LX-100]
MRFSMNWRVLWLSLLLVGGAAFAADGAPNTAPAAAAQAAQQRPGHAAIASANFHATEAGLEVLAKGGNAFDAAVAVAATLSVVEPESSGIGGGFMAVLHQAKDGRNVFIDARETAPAAVNPKDYLNPDGSPNRDSALKGPLSAGIPGQPAGLVLIAKRYGRLSLQQSLAPAIRIARDGFEPDARLRGAIASMQKDLARWPASAAKYLPNGKPPAEGAIWRDPDQARTLELIAAHGDDGFYRGETARKLVAAVRAAGGNWTLADLENYRAKERTPISVNYRGYRIITAPPPSSGGVAIAEILNILSGYDLTKMDQATRVHYIVEAMRRAFRDHNDYLGDPDFVQMPLDMLLSPYYAAGLRQGILHDKATPSSMLPRAEAPEPGMHTTHFSIIDADGNMAAVTSTVNYTMGSSFVAAGTGVLLNDEMDDFALVPNKPNVYGLLGSAANAPKGGKRMLSSMSPSIVIGADRTAVIGSPGGSTIITQVLEGILHFIDGESAQQIAAHKRFHHQYLPDVVNVEDGTFDAATSEALTKMGYTLKPRESWGFMNVVTWDRKANQLDAASDPRRPSGLGKVQ